MNKKYTKEKLQEVANKCFSFRQMLFEFGLKEAGGNYANIQNRCKSFGVDTSHFFGKAWNKKEHPSFEKNGKPLDEYFVKGDIKLSSARVKYRLINNGLRDYKCERCGLVEWLGGRIVIELHHRNGDPTDNRLENLQLLCPNCHSQTHNYCKRQELRKEKSLQI
jgi:5-methylcytosine-specific restriction endonuclease McrA